MDIHVQVNSTEDIMRSGGRLNSFRTLQGSLYFDETSYEQ